MSVDRAEIVAARAVGVGIGFIVLMVTWLAGNRIAALVWDPPTGPTVAFVSAIVAGVITALVVGSQLAARVREGR